MHTTEDYEALFLNLEAFVSRQPEFNEAFGCLKKNAEIGLKIDQMEGVLKSVDNTVVLMRGKPSKADVEFEMSPAAASQLAQSRPNSMGDLGVDVLKMTASGEVKIRVVGKVFSVLTGGYLSIVKKAGPEFMGFLGSKGFKSVTKISQAIKNMKS